jgi:hypothetical protein
MREEKKNKKKGKFVRLKLVTLIDNNFLPLVNPILGE